MLIISQEKLPRTALILLVILVLSVFIGGAMPGAGKLFPAPWDKAVHIATFGAMAVLAGLAFPRRSLLMILLMVFLLGAADEFHQMFIHGRQPGWDDLLADVIGGALALPVIWQLRSWIARTFK